MLDSFFLCYCEKIFNILSSFITVKSLFVQSHPASSSPIPVSSCLLSSSLLPFFPVMSCSGPYSSFPFRLAAWFHFVPSRPVPFCHVLIGLAPYYRVTLCLAPFRVVLSRSFLLPSLPALSNTTLCHPTRSSLVLSRLVLSNSIDSHPAPTLFHWSRSHPVPQGFCKLRKGRLDLIPV